jgi:hypothetical protein
MTVAIALHEALLSHPIRYPMPDSVGSGHSGQSLERPPGSARNGCGGWGRG